MTPTKDDEREAREWLTNAANFGIVHEDDIKHRATILALLDAPRMPRPENLTNDVLDAMHAAHSVSLNTHEQFTFVRTAMRAAYRAIYDHYTAPPQPKKPLVVWGVYTKGDMLIASFVIKDEAEHCANRCAGRRIVKLTEDR